MVLLVASGVTTASGSPGDDWALRVWRSVWAAVSAAPLPRRKTRTSVAVATLSASKALMMPSATAMPSAGAETISVFDAASAVTSTSRSSSGPALPAASRDSRTREASSRCTIGLRRSARALASG